MSVSAISAQTSWVRTLEGCQLSREDSGKGKVQAKGEKKSEGTQLFTRKLIHETNHEGGKKERKVPTPP